MRRNAWKLVLAALTVVLAVACGTTYSSPPPEYPTGDLEGSRFETMRALADRPVLQFGPLRLRARRLPPDRARNRRPGDARPRRGGALGRRVQRLGPPGSFRHVLLRFGGSRSRVPGVGVVGGPARRAQLRRSAPGRRTTHRSRDARRESVLRRVDGLVGGRSAAPEAFGHRTLRRRASRIMAIVRVAPRAKRYLAAIAVLSAATLVCSISIRGQSPLPLDRIRLPSGFEIRLWARAPGARSMTLSPGGTLYVGTREEGNVYAVRTGSGGEA